MLTLPLTRALSRPPRVLLLGAHCDDIELGCGATLLRLATERPDCELRWAIAASDSARETEARASARDFTEALHTPADVVVAPFRDGFLPYHAVEVKEWVHSLGESFTPDVVFTHAPHDLHQDHRFLAEVALQAFRDQLILGFEIPKFDGDLGAPNVFVTVDEAQADQKCQIVATRFRSQADKMWFDDETFRGLMRLRGVESRSPSGYAEGFYCRKLVLAI